MEPTDIELVERVRGGDDDSFRLLVERHSRALYRSAYRVHFRSSHSRYSMADP